MIDCGVCGKDFETNEEYKDHVAQAHEAMNSTYEEAFCKASEGAKDWWESQSPVAQEQILIASGVDPRHKGLSWQNLGQENQALIKQEYYEAREGYNDKGNYSEKCKTCGKVFDNPADAGSHSHGSNEVYWKDIGDKKVIDKGNHYELEDGGTIDWSSYDAKDAQAFLKQKAKEAKIGDFDDDRISISHYKGDGKWDSIKDIKDIDKDKAEEDSMDDLQYRQHFGHDWWDKKAKKKKEKSSDEGSFDNIRKVDALSESWNVLDKETKAKVFESLGITQGDAYTLANLDWYNLSPQLKTEASEAYAKEEDDLTIDNDEDLFALHKGIMDKPVKDDKEVNEAYADIYNIEKNHQSPDFKKKALECSRCNEKFYNKRDRDIHFNELHATEQEYTLDDECPFCKEKIKEPETLDWHMEQEHGIHTPSQYTQTGIQGAMSGTDFDSTDTDFYTEAFDSDWACPRCGNKKVTIKKDEYGNPTGRECPKCGLGKESYASEAEGKCPYCGSSDISSDKYDYMKCNNCNKGFDVPNEANESLSDKWWWKDVNWESGFDQDFLFCKHCGKDLYVDADHKYGNFKDESVDNVVSEHLKNHGIVNESRANEENPNHADDGKFSSGGGSHKKEVTRKSNWKNEVDEWLSNDYERRQIKSDLDKYGSFEVPSRIKKNLGIKSHDSDSNPWKTWEQHPEWIDELVDYAKKKATEAKDRPTVEGDPVSIASRNCYDWEGYEIDCDSGERIGQGYSKSKAYQQFLNEAYDEWTCSKCGAKLPYGKSVGDHLLDHGITFESKAEEWSTGISSSDPTAITQLEAKLARLEDEKAEIKARPIVPRDWSFSPEDSRGFELTNINANIRSVKQRIASLKSGESIDDRDFDSTIGSAVFDDQPSMNVSGDKPRKNYYAHDKTSRDAVEIGESYANEFDYSSLSTEELQRRQERNYEKLETLKTQGGLWAMTGEINACTRELQKRGISTGSIIESVAKEEGFWDDENNFEVDIDKYLETGKVEKKATEARWQCDVCGKQFEDSQGATQHEKETGHHDMGFATTLSGDSKWDKLSKEANGSFLPDGSHLGVPVGYEYSCSQCHGYGIYPADYDSGRGPKCDRCNGSGIEPGTDKSEYTISQKRLDGLPEYMKGNEAIPDEAFYKTYDTEEEVRAIGAKNPVMDEYSGQWYWNNYVWRLQHGDDITNRDGANENKADDLLDQWGEETDYEDVEAGLDFLLAHGIDKAEAIMALQRHRGDTSGLEATEINRSMEECSTCGKLVGLSKMTQHKKEEHGEE